MAFQGRAPVVPRLPCGHAARQGRGRRGAARPYQGRNAQAQQPDQGAEVHPARPALHRSLAGARTGRARHRPPLHLCLDHLHPSGSRLCDAGGKAFRAHGLGPRGVRPSARALQDAHGRGLHRAHGRTARQGGRRPAGLGGPAPQLQQRFRSHAARSRQEHGQGQNRYGDGYPLP